MFRTCMSLLFIAVFISISSFSQGTAVKEEKAVKTESTEKKDVSAAETKPVVKDEYPIQPIKTDVFDIKDLTFSRKIDTQGKGELLQVEFALTPNTDYKYKLYIHVLATIEEETWNTSTIFGKRLSQRGIETRLFVPFPPTTDLKNFEFQVDGKTKLLRLPHDYKTGINPLTKEPYTLEKYTIIRTQHLSPYRKNFKYFNYVTLIIYDDEGKILHRQIYKMTKFRH